MHFSVPKCVILEMSLRHAPHASGDDPIKDLGFVVFPTLVGIGPVFFTGLFRYPLRRKRRHRMEYRNRLISKNMPDRA